MNLTLILFFVFVGILLLLLGWALWKPRTRSKLHPNPGVLEIDHQRHVDYLPCIRQAFAEMDNVFLSKHVSREVLRRIRRERRGIALAYVAALHHDFQTLLRTARVIASLSPELTAVHEFERMRLTAKFQWQYQMIRWRLLAGIAPVPQLHGLSDLVSGLSVRIEAALKELGERAAAAAELASSMNRGGLDVV